MTQGWTGMFRRSFAVAIKQAVSTGILAVLWLYLAVFSVGAYAEVLLYPVVDRVYASNQYIAGFSDRPNDTLDIEVNGTIVAQTQSNATGEFALSVALSEGENLIRARSTISAEVSDTQALKYLNAGDSDNTDGQLEVRIDIVAPTLNLPNTDGLTNPITLTGIAEPGSTVSFFVNGRVTRSIDVDDSGAFSTWVPLEDGDNSIYAIAETDAGQSVASNSVATTYANTLARDWSGNLSNTLVWTKGDGSPYILNSNLNVPQGVTLWIQPGVEVIGDGSYQLNVSGHLQVAGILEEPVKFRPMAQACNDTSPSRYDWKGIEVIAGATAIIDYAEVYCASNGIYFNGGDGYVRNSKLLNNWMGIRTRAASAEIRIAPVLAGNTIRGNREGIFIYHNSDPKIIGGNVIVENNNGINVTGNYDDAAQNPAPLITANSIYDNSSYNYNTSTFANPSTTTLDARGNWWGSANPSQIAAKIYDRAYNTLHPIVNYSLFLNGPGGDPAYTGAVLFGPIVEDATLSGESYLVLGPLEISADTVLTLTAGTQLNFGTNNRLLVKGKLEANGNAEEPVIIKPVSEACNGNSVHRSDWKGVEIIAGATANLNYTEVHCASIGVHFNGGEGSVRNSKLLNNKYGIRTEASSAASRIAPEIFRNTILGSMYGITVYHNSDPHISGGNNITMNYFGIYAFGHSTDFAQNPIPTVTGNSIYNNIRYNFYTQDYSGPHPVTLDATGNWWGSVDPPLIADKIHDSVDSYDANSIVDYRYFLDALEGNPVFIEGALLGYITEDTTLAGDSYLILGRVELAAGTVLTIPAGTELRFIQDVSLVVRGSLEIKGTEMAPVLFKPDNEGCFKYWGGIEIVKGATVTADYAEVSCASRGIYFSGGDGSIRNSKFLNNDVGIFIKADSAESRISPEIFNNTFLGNEYGIKVYSFSDPLIKGNEFSFNRYGVYVLGGSVIGSNPVPVVKGNRFFGNNYYAFYANYFDDSENVSLDATGNWWGTVDETMIASYIYTAGSSSPHVDFSGYLDLLQVSDVALKKVQFHPLEGEQVEGSFSLNHPASVTIEIRRESDNALVYQETEIYTEAGVYPIHWNGRNNENKLQIEGLYRVVLRASDNLDDYIYDEPQLRMGYVEGFVPAHYDVYTNEFYKVSVEVESPSLVSMQVTPRGESAFNVFKDTFYPEGQHWIYWDGRDPEGNIVESPASIYYPIPRLLRSTDIYLAGTAPRITGAIAAPSIEVKSDPYRVSHSYEQLTRMAYQVSTDAVVTFSLLPPGIVDPGHPSAIVLVDEQLMSAQDGEGNTLLHEVKWRGYNDSDPNAVLVGDEGAYTFAIQATSPESGESSLYRGVVNLYR
ncbi:NosD domain-containing protein [Microbulbifer epialgicus]|uniref:NosD domain-containing protein n=1 Tax=Microbulbifer epialgicus TaxID=393907 RepID=A0ABV4NUI5_9GAMM